MKHPSLRMKHPPLLCIPQECIMIVLDINDYLFYCNVYELP